MPAKDDLGTIWTRPIDNEFQAWADQQGMNLFQTGERDKTRYVDVNTEAAYQAWQAAKRLFDPSEDIKEGAALKQLALNLIPGMECCYGSDRIVIDTISASGVNYRSMDKPGGGFILKRAWNNIKSLAQLAHAV